MLKPKSKIKDQGLFCTTNIGDLEDCTCYIVTVPTPVDETKRPVFTPLIMASVSVGKVLKKDDIVIMNLPFILELQKKFVFQS